LAPGLAISLATEAEAVSFPELLPLQFLEYGGIPYVFSAWSETGNILAWDLTTSNVIIVAD